MSKNLLLQAEALQTKLAVDLKNAYSKVTRAEYDVEDALRQVNEAENHASAIQQQYNAQSKIVSDMKKKLALESYNPYVDTDSLVATDLIR